MKGEPVKKKYTVFVVVGRLGKSLTASKAVPFAIHPEVENVFIFREQQGFSVPKSRYITLDKILEKAGPRALRTMLRFLLEPLQIIRCSVKYKPCLINGVYTLPKGLNALIAARLTGAKSMISVIGGTVEITTRLPIQWFWKDLNLWMLKKCDVVTTKGTRVSKWLAEQGIPAEKIFILNGSIDTDTFYMDPETEKDIDILFVGNFSPLKGPDRVLSVIKSLVSKGKQIKAVYLGTGALFSEIERQVEEFQLGDFVSLMGYQENIVPYFQRAKILMMPSTSEGLPTAMLEAMACGCVPVVSDVGNITDAAEHGVNAMVVSHWNDINGFTQAADKLLHENKFRNSLAIRGREVVVEHYSPDKQSEIVDQIINYISEQ